MKGVLDAGSTPAWSTRSVV